MIQVSAESGVGEYLLNFNRSLVDFGDAPDVYPTLSEDDGAYHGIIEGFRLGAVLDEAADELTVLPVLLPDHLEGDVAFQVGVVPLEDLPDAALGDAPLPGAAEDLDVAVTTGKDRRLDRADRVVVGRRRFRGAGAPPGSRVAEAGSGLRLSGRHWRPRPDSTCTGREEGIAAHARSGAVQLRV